VVCAVRFSKTARRDVRRLTPKMKSKLKTILLEVVAREPYSGKHLLGNLEGLYSVRLDIRDRIVCSIDGAHCIVYVHRAKTPYGE